MDSYIEETDVETLRSFVKDSYMRSSDDLSIILLSNANKYTILKTIKQAFNYEKRFRLYLVKNGDIQVLTKLFEKFPPTPDELNSARTQATVNLMLDTGVDLNLVPYFAQLIRLWVIDYILTKELKVKVNPNGYSPQDGNKVPFWRKLGPAFGTDGESLIEHSSTPSNVLEGSGVCNFTENVNINAQCGAGRTIVHSCMDLEPILKYKPDPHIKDNLGQTPLEYRKKMSYPTDKLEKYIENLKDPKQDLIQDLCDKITRLSSELASVTSELASVTSELAICSAEKTQALKELEEYVAKQAQLRKILSI